jgi:peptidoglycan hydrolase CwlO-like protein
MVEQQKTNTGQGLGIAGLVLGIISIPLAVMGCTFIIALLFGAAGIVFSAIGLSQAKEANGARGITTAGLVVSIVGSAIAILWFLFLGAFIQDAMDHKGKWFDKLENLEEISRDLEEESEESIDEQDMDDLENKMEDLEGEIKGEEDTLNETGEDVKKAEEELEKLRKEQNQ